MDEPYCPVDDRTARNKRASDKSCTLRLSTMISTDIEKNTRAVGVVLVGHKKQNAPPPCTRLPLQLCLVYQTDTSSLLGAAFVKNVFLETKTSVWRSTHLYLGRKASACGITIDSTTQTSNFAAVKTVLPRLYPVHIQYHDEHRLCRTSIWYTIGLLTFRQVTQLLYQYSVCRMAPMVSSTAIRVTQRNEQPLHYCFLLLQMSVLQSMARAAILLHYEPSIKLAAGIKCLSSKSWQDTV